MNLTDNANEQVIADEQEFQHHEWKKPIPLNLVLAAETPYPIDALPQILRNAVSTYQQYGQQPLAWL